ncbi:MAG: BLUF domain-containing protein [Synechococcales cyanobacterium]
MSLHRLIYISHAKAGLGYYDLRDIQEKSERNNSRDGISGLLCFGNGLFLQVLEGSRVAISQTYHRIAADPRHNEPELVDFRDVEQRLFTVWSMKVTDLGSQASEKVQHLHLKHGSSPAFDPTSMTAVQCLNLMIDLAQLYAD